MFISHPTSRIAIFASAVAIAQAILPSPEAHANSTARINAIIGELTPAHRHHQSFEHRVYPHHFGAYHVKRHRFGRTYRPRHVKKHFHHRYRKHARQLNRAYSLQVNFRPGSTRILTSEKPALDDLGLALESRRLTGKRFLIIGHTDAVGTKKQNLRLSKLRAAAVRRYLLSRFDIAPHRLVAVGFGEERLFDPSRPRSYVNRRVEVAVLTSDTIKQLGHSGHNGKHDFRVSGYDGWR